MPYLSYILTALGAYLLGSIPTGYLVAKAKGIDIRSVGSGNIGATNAMRVLGKPAGIFVLLMDALKGYGACLLGSYMYCKFGPFAFSHFCAGDFRDRIFHFFYDPTVVRQCAPILGGVFAVLGHNYTCWLKFKGGKGIATSAGVFLALAPLALGICVAVFAVALLLTRYVSVGSIAAALALPVAVWFTRDDTLLRGVTIVLGALAIYKHKANLQRLRAGTENRLNFTRKKTPQ